MYITAYNVMTCLYFNLSFFSQGFCFEINLSSTSYSLECQGIKTSGHQWSPSTPWVSWKLIWHQFLFHSLPHDGVAWLANIYQSLHRHIVIGHICILIVVLETSMKERLMRGNHFKCKLFPPHEPPSHARSSPTMRIGIRSVEVQQSRQTIKHVWLGSFGLIAQ